MYLVVGIIMVVVSIVLKHWLRKRNFERRNAFGVQQFRSYSHAWFTQTMEGLGGHLANILLILGLLSILLNYSGLNGKYRDKGGKPEHKTAPNQHHKTYGNTGEQV